MKTNKESIKKIIIFSFVLMLLFPTLSFAIWKPGNGIVPKCTGANGCEFNDFITLIANFMDFLLFYMSIPLAAVLFAIAGFKLLTSGGSEQALSSAKSLLWNVVIGLTVALSAWLIVKGILTLVAPGFSLLGS